LTIYLLDFYNRFVQVFTNTGSCIRSASSGKHAITGHLRKGNNPMAIEKWQPFGSVRDFDDLFNRFLGNRSATARHAEPEAWSIPLDVVQDGDNLVVTASVPGTAKNEIDISVDDNVLTIKAETANSSAKDTDGYLLRERRTGSYYRALRLPETVDYENAESTFQNGVLTIKLPKLESKKARKLEISAV
jgi:HSP20 family protein